MKQIIIHGGKILSGKVDISGAKNSAVALIPASLLSDDTITISNIPHISDIDALNEILLYLGAKVAWQNNTIKIDASNVVSKKIPKEVSAKLRASYYFMSALLGKYQHVEMYFPGGCDIGSRPIDQTLKGFRALGATVIEEDNFFKIFAKNLTGAYIYLDMPSVGATINTILVAVRATGETTIENAAREPEIVNVANFLNTMGAKITGAGTSKIKITGVVHLKSGFAEVIPDRIEAGTYLIAGALAGDNLVINNIIPEHIENVILKLKEMNVPMQIEPTKITVSKSTNLQPTKIRTAGYPGFPTDLQQPITVLLAMAHGKSALEETIYENRFQNIVHLNNMGANIKIISHEKIDIIGPTNYVGAKVVATDLRAGACMILAALIANNKTHIDKAEHILRGYENIEEKLRAIGADIKIVDIE